VRAEKKRRGRKKRLGQKKGDNENLHRNLESSCNVHTWQNAGTQEVFGGATRRKAGVGSHGTKGDGKLHPNNGGRWFPHSRSNGGLHFVKEKWGGKRIERTSQKIKALAIWSKGGTGGTQLAPITEGQTRRSFEHRRRGKPRTNDWRAGSCLKRRGGRLGWVAMPYSAEVGEGERDESSGEDHRASLTVDEDL